MLRRTCALLALAMAASLLLAPAQADHANPPGPTAAYNTYGWWYGGSLRWREEFETGSLNTRNWTIGGWGLRKGGNVRHQHGMLTLNTGKRGTVAATLNRRGRKYGRWEMRLRSRRYSTHATDYRVVTELVPRANPHAYCGAKNIALEHYRIGAPRTNYYIRTLRENAFRSSQWLRMRNDEWHTFGVEVTPDRISWYVDAHVVATETRPAALDGAYFTVRFKMQAQPGKWMNESRMQMDWLRSWSLDTPPKRTREINNARQPWRGIYWQACDRHGNQIR